MYRFGYSGSDRAVRWQKGDYQQNGVSERRGGASDDQWVHKARWVQDGTIWTSSGVTAGMDMAHAFMASTYGQDAAEKMACYMENVPNVDPHDDPFAAM